MPRITQSRTPTFLVTLFLAAFIVSGLHLVITNNKSGETFSEVEEVEYLVSPPPIPKDEIVVSPPPLPKKRAKQASFISTLIAPEFSQMRKDAKKPVFQTEKGYEEISLDFSKIAKSHPQKAAKLLVKASYKMASRGGGLGDTDEGRYYFLKDWNTRYPQLSRSYLPMAQDLLMLSARIREDDSRDHLTVLRRYHSGEIRNICLGYYANFGAFGLALGEMEKCAMKLGRSPIDKMLKQLYMAGHLDRYTKAFHHFSRDYSLGSIYAYTEGLGVLAD